MTCTVPFTSSSTWWLPEFRFTSRLLAGVFLVLASIADLSSALAAPAFVQVASAVPQSPQTTVSATFAAVQSAGNANVVAVGWFNTTARVVSVQDTVGNVYQLAVGPTTQAQAGTQAMYYAVNIGAAAAGGNQVTVTFDAAVPYPDLRVAEYRGVDTGNPIDVVSAGVGTGVTSSSGAVTTTNANDLLVGANYVTTTTTAVGAGYTSRVITNPDGSILEDRIVAATGSYSATATLQSGQWIMQMIALRAAGAVTDSQAPTAPSGLGATAVSSAQINLSWTASTDNVGVTNYLIERCQGAGCSTFTQVGTSVTPAFSNTGLTASTSYSYRVRATDAANNLSAYSGTASATTQAAVDSQAPTAPSGLGATAVSSAQINLSWTASTDNVGVTNYLIERCQGAGCSTFTQVGTSVTPAFSNTGLTASTSYSYRVRATDAANNLSAYSGTASATTQAAVDSQAPTAPSGLGATAVSSAQINLSWTASTDNVGVTNYLIERCQGAGCSTFTQVGTSVTPAFSNTGLTASTSYSYRVRATDAANNLSAYSGTASATTQAAVDSQAPTAPSGLGATAVSSAQINLSWTASTDNVGVTNYLIERCQGAGCSTFTQVGTSVTPAFSNTGLTASTSYSYRVRATDAANNLSAYSGTASATTQAGGSASLAFVQVASAVPQSPQTTVSATFAAVQSAGNANVVAVGWFNTTAHVVSVQDTVGNVYQLAVGPTTQAQAGTQAMYYAVNIGAAAAGGNQVTVTFDAAVPYPDLRVAEYRGVDTGNPIDVVSAGVGTGVTSSSGAVTTTNANDLLVGANYVTTGTTAAGGGYTSRVITNPDGSILEDRIVAATGSYSATATLQSGQWIMQMIALRAAGAVTDSQAPTAPSGLGATAVSSAQINLSWTASTDNVGVTNYLIERCQGAGCSTFTQVGTSVTPAFSNTGLTASTSYSYRVRATDAANNLSAYSGTASATTQAAVDSQAPTAPSGLGATAVSSAQINLSWTASTDNVGVTNYLIERCQGAGCSTFTQVGTSVTPAFSNTGLTASTSYSYRVRATDAANNLSAYSGTASATTQAAVDSQAPTAPSGLGATAVSSAQINLSWTASTDNVGVTNYLIERCQGAGCSTFTQVGTSVTPAFSNTGLTASTSYSYRVRATDAANNLSAYSGTASATTQAGGSASLAFVQVASAVPQSPQTTVSATFAAVQSAGNANVVAVGWFNTTAHVVSVQDTVGNVYQLAVGPTTQAQAGTQAMYYAVNIGAAAAGGNQVTVTFDAAVPYPDLRVAEYRGVDTGNPIDVVSAGVGTGVTSSSGAVTTTNANDLLVGANYVTTGTTAAGGGYTSRVITNPDGSILEDRIVAATGSYSATATLQSGQWIMQMIVLRGQSVAPDTTPPITAISFPGSGASLSGVVTLVANASDVGSGVAGVQFQIDGVNIGNPVTSGPPYSLSFDTAQMANGNHTITAYAWDLAQNFTDAAPVTVTFNNAAPGNPAQTGLWSGLLPWPVVSIHLNMLTDGRVIAWDQFATGVSIPYIWDPVTSEFAAAPTNDGQNLFCSGHVTLGDGRLFVAGGEINYQAGVANSYVGLASGHIFDPTTNQWSTTPDMAVGRWYPNLTTLPDGRVLVLAGDINCRGCEALIPEIYDPTTNSWTALNDAPLELPFYPYSSVLPDGRVMIAGATEAPFPATVFDLSTHVWTTIDSRNIDGGSAVMYLPGRFMKAGTSSDGDSATRGSSASTYVLDMTSANLSWRQVASMNFPRTYHVLTSLPDGTVIATGGGRTTAVADLATAVYQAELWSPVTETWTTLASMHAPREYHQTALLLPDARVLVTGAGRGLGHADPTDQLSGEVFAPPYLFKGARPTIASAPSQLGYAQNFIVQTPDSARIAGVSLIRLGNVTHTFGMDQRYVPLPFTRGTGSLTVTSPPNANLAPPGYYMLFLVDTNGVPSVASIVRF